MGFRRCFYSFYSRLCYYSIFLNCCLVLIFEVLYRSIDSKQLKSQSKGRFWWCKPQDLSPSKIMGLILTILSLVYNTWAKRRQSTLNRNSWVFSGYSGFHLQGILTDWVKKRPRGTLIKKPLTGSG